MYNHIHCHLLRSRYLLAWLAIVVAWVILLLWWIVIPPAFNYYLWFLRIVILIGLVFHLRLIVLRDYCLTRSNSITAFDYNNGEWRLQIANGEKINATLRHDSVVWYELLVLGFDLPNKKPRFITLFPDSCDKDTQRKLRVQLRLLARKQQAHSSNWQKLKAMCRLSYGNHE